MKRLLPLVALLAATSFASLATGCATPTSDVAESNAALEEHEAAYVGDYRATMFSNDEIQSLSLKSDNTFYGLIGTALMGVEECQLQPCVAETTGRWSIAKNADGATLSIVPEGKTAINYVIEVTETGLKLTRGTVIVALTKYLNCPSVTVEAVECPNGDLVSSYDKNGCFQSVACVAKPPVVLPTCPAVTEDPGATCDNGTWRADYNADGCYTGRTCVPTPPAPAKP